MINKKFTKKLQQDYKKHESERQQIISLSNIVLHDSKRIIFALHRGDVKKAEEQFSKIEKILKNLEKEFSFTRLMQEGSYKAGVEEYVEAKLFYLVLSGKKLDKIKEVNISFDGYLGGMCDLTGELTRQAINQAASGNLGEVEKMKKIIQEIIAELVEFDMTGYLRAKYDQAKNSLRKIEQINYETNLKQGVAN